MSTFENGWICKKCWKANRDEDIRCYRCKALHPDLTEIGDSPKRSRSLRPSMRPVSTGIRQAASRTAAPVMGGARHVVHTGRAIAMAVVTFPVRAIRSGARFGRTAVSFAANALAGFMAAGASVARSAGRAAASAVASAGRAAVWVVVSARRAVVSALRGAARAVTWPVRGTVRAGSRGLATANRFASVAALRLGALARQLAHLPRGIAARTHSAR